MFSSALLSTDSIMSKIAARTGRTKGQENQWKDADRVFEIQVRYCVFDVQLVCGVKDEIMAGRNDRGCWHLDSIVTTSVQPTSPNIYTIVISIDLFFVQLFSTHRSSRSSDILVQSTCQNWPFERAQINTKTARKTHRKGKSKCLRTNQRERRRRRRKSRGPVHSCCQSGDE